MAPYSGSVSVAKNAPNRIRLVPMDGGFINTFIFIDNIKPADNIPTDNFINVSVLKSFLRKSIVVLFLNCQITVIVRIIINAQR